jgi:hypothetical protein
MNSSSLFPGLSFILQRFYKMLQKTRNATKRKKFIYSETLMIVGGISMIFYILPDFK